MLLPEAHKSASRKPPKHRSITTKLSTENKAKMLLPEARKSGRVTRTERRFGRGKAARTDGRRRRTWRGPIGRGKRRAAGRRTAPRSRGA